MTDIPEQEKEVDLIYAVHQPLSSPHAIAAAAAAAAGPNQLRGSGNSALPPTNLPYSASLHLCVTHLTSKHLYKPLLEQGLSGTQRTVVC